MDMISAPLMPISLSSNLRTYSFLFWSKIAARQRAPSIPKEFFLMLPSWIPRSRDLMYEFLIISSRIKDNPTSLIILEARFRCSMRELEMRLLIACIPYSLMELSARLIVVNLHHCVKKSDTSCSQGLISVSWWCWLLIAWSKGSIRQGAFWSWFFPVTPWTFWPFLCRVSPLCLDNANKRVL